VTPTTLYAEATYKGGTKATMARELSAMNNGLPTTNLRAW